MGILFEVLLLISIVRLGGSLVESKLAGMLAATLLVTNPVFLLTSFCGMELSLYLFAIMVSIILLADKRYTVGVLVAAIVVWVRVDEAPAPAASTPVLVVGYFHLLCIR